ncbi:LPD23 domain-containing protein, partial [Campylobacter hyointestinalis]|uniref:LPD23 domain-containing protein n=1 Tax=Campylobacter hyointestinalis TaxID=198 RepID=UPI000B1FB088
AGYDAIDLMDKDILIVLKPNQIKSIDNKGTFNPRSKMMNGFSTMVMQKAILNLGSGAIGGAMNAGAEQDPNKKHEAFVKGFLLGAGGSAGAIKVLEKSANLAPQLARISQRLANDLPVILNDRPDIIGKALGKTPKDNYNYIFGGENAIGANKAKLKTAQEMAKNGADESEIWAKTGWYKDIDKKWKFEINPLGGKFKKAIKDLFDAKAFKQNNREKLELLQDKAKINDKYQTNLNKLNATLSQKASIITKAKDGLKLSEVLDDKKLFNAYPQLRDVKVRFDELDGEIYDGYYNRTLDEIVLNSNLYNKPEMLRSILYHEMQHKIQSIEGFARGGMDKDVLDYHRLAGEVEARNEQTRLIPSKLNNAKLERTTDLENLEKIVKALPKSQANEQISKELITLKKQDMALDNEYGKISPQRDKEIDRLTDELDNRFNALVEQIDKQELATALLKVYNKTKHPNATADVIPKFRKVVFNDSGMSAIYTPKQKEMKSQDLSVEQKAKQYAKFLSEAKEPTQVAPDELYKAYNKAKKDLNKPKSK